MTIHKSQASQAGDVTVVLPQTDSRALTYGLPFTVTRTSGLSRRLQD